MGALANTLGTMLKRPFIILFFGAVALGYSIFEFYFPVKKIFFNNPLSSGDVFKTTVDLLRWVLKLLVNARGIFTAFIALFIISLVLAILLSGLFNILNNTLDRKPGFKGEFKAGMRKYFLRIWFMSFLFLCLCILFALFIIISAVPAMIITKAAISGKSGFFITAVLVDIISGGVIFFGIMFFSMYLTFWFPAAVTDKKKAFKRGKLIADTFFWKLIFRFLAFDILFILFQFFLIKMGGSIVSIMAEWIFNTFFFAFYITYIFSLFKSCSNKVNQIG